MLPSVLEFPRGEVVEDAPVGHSLGVMELVDDYDLERIGRDVGNAIGGQGLHGREHVLPSAPDVRTDVKLAEVRSPSTSR